MPRLPTPKPINLRKPPTLRKGPAGPSKRVLDRYKAVRRLLGTIKARKADAAAGFVERLAPELGPGETVPDQTLALELAGRSVERAYQVLEDADYAYSGNGVSRGILTDACRHTAETEIYPELRDVRREIEGRFGREKGRLVHRMEGHTRRKPRRQHPQLDRLVRSIKNRKRYLVVSGTRYREIPGQPGPEETAFVGEIFEVAHFRALVGERQRLLGQPVADPFLIAAAKVLESCVVTEEKLRPNAAGIPNVCAHFEIDCTNVEGFLERHGWTF